MPAIVQILSLYVGDNPVARHSRSAGPLTLPKDMAVHLARWLRDGVLNRQAGFRGRVEIEGLPPLEVEWVGTAGQTAGGGVVPRRISRLRQRPLVGAGRCSRAGRGFGGADRQAAARPPDINETLDKFPRPLLVNVHYSLASQTDPLQRFVRDPLAVAAPAKGTAAIAATTSAPRPRDPECGAVTAR
jgi:hypothetical protein